MFYEGLSLTKISNQLKSLFNDDVDPSTIYLWIIEYSQKARHFLDGLQIDVGNVWVVDETVITVGGQNVWFWDVIDEETRFLLASHLSIARTINDVAIVMENALQRVKVYPNVIISDKWPAYPKGIERIFGSHARHIKSQGFTAEINTNLIERFHGTLKERLKVLRGFKDIDTAELILDGFIIHYNFFRPHITLKNTTPVQEAGIDLPFDNWEGLLRYLPQIGIH